MDGMQSTEKSSGALSSELKTANVGKFRRNSTGDANMKPASSPVSSQEKVVSRYLRASTGSCHDLCKYGGRHAFDSKEEYPVSLLFRKRGSVRKQQDKKDVSSGKNRKNRTDAKLVKSASRLEGFSSPNMLCDSSQSYLVEDSPVVSDSVQNDLMDNFPAAACPGDSEDRADKFMATTVLETMDNNEDKQSGSLSSSMYHAHGNGNLRLQRHRTKLRVASEPPETVQSPQKQVLDSKQELSTETAFPNVSRDIGGVADGGTKFKDIEVSEIKEIKEADISSLSSHIQDRGAAGLKTKEFKVKHLSSTKKRESHSKSLLASRRKPLATKAPLPPLQPLLASNRKPLATKAPLSNLSNNSGGIANGHKKANDASQVRGKKELRPSVSSTFNLPAPIFTQPGLKKQHKKNSPSTSPPVNGGSGLKSTKYLEKKHPVPWKKTMTGILSTVDGTCTKTKHKIVNIGDRCDNEPNKLSPEASPASAPPSLPSSSSLTSSEEDQESKSIRGAYEDVGFETENGAKISSQEKQGPKRGCGVQTQDEDVPHKLTFRSGKVIDSQSERDSPRRLKFRQYKMIENKDGRDEVRRTFKKKGSPLANNAKNAGHAGPAVVLRHQDIHAKKGAQNLNQVIEETANKLVESRKSKVKALVGAFETVISLSRSFVS